MFLHLNGFFFSGLCEDVEVLPISREPLWGKAHSLSAKKIACIILTTSDCFIEPTLIYSMHESIQTVTLTQQHN